MSTVFVVPVLVIAIPLLLMIAACLLERVESAWVPRARRTVGATSSPRHLSLVPESTSEGAVDPDFDPDATAQLRRAS